MAADQTPCRFFDVPVQTTLCDSDQPPKGKTRSPAGALAGSFPVRLTFFQGSQILKERPEALDGSCLRMRRQPPNMYESVAMYRCLRSRISVIH